jgi:hypothetical protein
MAQKEIFELINVETFVALQSSMVSTCISFFLLTENLTSSIESKIRVIVS